MPDHPRSQPDVVVLVSSWPAALRWATRHGYRRPLFPHSISDLNAVPAGCPVYADESLWQHARAETLALWLQSRLQAAQPLYLPREWVDRFHGSPLN